MSVILGVNAFHADSAACLVVDGELRAAIAEERLADRVKHCPRFPDHAIRRVLGESGLSLADVTHVAIARDTRANLLQKVGYVARHPFATSRAVLEHQRRRGRTRSFLEQLAGICGEPAARVNFQVVPVEHHLAHIASAYYVSPFDQLTAAFSYDASGDFVSGMAARCEGTRIEIVGRMHLPHSLGFFYTAICQLIGFDGFGEEYKVMGLAPYGEDRYGDLMKRVVRLDAGGWYRLSTPYFNMHSGGESGVVDGEGRIRMQPLYTESLRRLLVTSVRHRDEPLEPLHRDLARSCQVRFEQAAVHCLRRLHTLVPTHRLVMAGGCALNGVANARILRETAFERQYLQCAGSDDGTCIGAAYHCYHGVLGGTNRFHMRHAYWGPSYDEGRCREAAEASGHRWRKLSEAALLDTTVEYLVQGKVVGWYQGASEWGPRALGNRSILANPTIPDMKDTINAKIKRRESFRPFAPSVLEEHVSTYFEQPVLSPFMMHVVRFKPEWRRRLPAVTHVDGTGRLQTVSREDNPLYHALISRFHERTGVAVLLNTSFNENEPIVDTPQQAVDCFRRTDMDVLVLGSFMIEKCAARIIDTGLRGGRVSTSTIRTSED